jgi:glycosyltransferase involved in cell wall biosynthesis
MRICFLEYTPYKKKVTALCSFPMAASLARRGHDIHILTGGIDGLVNHEEGVWIHEVAPCSSLKPVHPHLLVDGLLNIAQRLYEVVLRLSVDAPFDLIEAPLEDVQSFVVLQRYQAPVVLNLEIRSTSMLDGSLAPQQALNALRRVCLQHASGLTGNDETTVQAIIAQYNIQISVPFFIRTNSSESEVDRLLPFYEEIVVTRGHNRSLRISHVMEALDTGDAVSAIARRAARILADFGQDQAILARFWNPSLSGEVKPLHHAFLNDSGMIFHYWNYNTSIWLLRAIRCRKALYYHNITPENFFFHDTNIFIGLRNAYHQLSQIIDMFDIIVGDSWYNIEGTLKHSRRSIPALAIYPVVEPVDLKSQPWDQDLLESLSVSGEVNIIFIGRIARNKRQDRLMDLFDYYWREINPNSRLWLVGSERSDPLYYAMLERLRQTLPSGERIHFTGKVADSVINSYYRIADVFVCASEHEGFCMPIAEAMAFDVPVIAYAAAAVPETMGGAGVLVHEWDVPRVAELINLLVTDMGLRQRVIDGQRRALARFSEDEARIRLKAVVDYLLDGTISPLFAFSKDQLSLRHESLGRFPV